MLQDLRSYTEMVYEKLVKEYFLLKSNLPLNEKLKAIEELYYFAWFMPFGRYADVRLENELKELFTNSELAKEKINVKTPKNVLHIVSSLYGTGGHSRILLNWIKNDKEHKHTVIVTTQDTLLSETIAEQLKGNCSELIILDKGKNPLLKAKDILLSCNSGHFAAIFHLNPDDIAPVLAAFHPYFPPVAIYNHADHLMWAGVSVSDVIINFREIGERYTYKYRGARKSMLIPYIIDNEERNPDKISAKEKLKVGGYKFCGVAIASPYKLQPFDSRNFYDVLYEFLIIYPDIIFYLIGPTENDWKKNSNNSIPPNLCIKGIIENIEEYIYAADFCFETFPFAGGMGSADICKYGAIPFFYKNAIEIASLKTILDYSVCLPPGEHLIRYDFGDFSEIRDLLNDSNRIQVHNKAVKEFIRLKYNKAEWDNKMASIYKILSETRYTCEFGRQLPVDDSSNSVFFNNALIKSKRGLFYFLLKTNKYKWIRPMTLFGFKLLRFKTILPEF